MLRTEEMISYERWQWGSVQMLPFYGQDFGGEEEED